MESTETKLSFHTSDPLHTPQSKAITESDMDPNINLSDIVGSETDSNQNNEPQVSNKFISPNTTDHSRVITQETMDSDLILAFSASESSNTLPCSEVVSLKSPPAKRKFQANTRLDLQKTVPELSKAKVCRTDISLINKNKDLEKSTLSLPENKLPAIINARTSSVVSNSDTSSLPTIETISGMPSRIADTDVENNGHLLNLSSASKAKVKKMYLDTAKEFFKEANKVRKKIRQVNTQLHLDMLACGSISQVVGEKMCETRTRLQNLNLRYEKYTLEHNPDCNTKLWTFPASIAGKLGPAAISVQRRFISVRREIDVLYSLFRGIIDKRMVPIKQYNMQRSEKNAIRYPVKKILSKRKERLKRALGKSCDPRLNPRHELSHGTFPDAGSGMLKKQHTSFETKTSDLHDQNLFPEKTFWEKLETLRKEMTVTQQAISRVSNLFREKKYEEAQKYMTLIERKLDTLKKNIKLVRLLKEKLKPYSFSNACPLNAITHYKDAVNRMKSLKRQYLILVEREKEGRSCDDYQTRTRFVTSQLSPNKPKPPTAVLSSYAYLNRESQAVNRLQKIDSRYYPELGDISSQSSYMSQPKEENERGRLSSEIGKEERTQRNNEMERNMFQDTSISKGVMASHLSSISQSCVYNAPELELDNVNTYNTINERELVEVCSSYPPTFSKVEEESIPHRSRSLISTSYTYNTELELDNANTFRAVNTKTTYPERELFNLCRLYAPTLSEVEKESISHRSQEAGTKSFSYAYEPPLPDRTNYSRFNMPPIDSNTSYCSSPPGPDFPYLYRAYRPEEKDRLYFPEFQQFEEYGSQYSYMSPFVQDDGPSLRTGQINEKQRERKRNMVEQSKTNKDIMYPDTSNDHLSQSESSPEEDLYWGRLQAMLSEMCSMCTDLHHRKCQLQSFMKVHWFEAKPHVRKMLLHISEKIQQFEVQLAKEKREGKENNYSLGCYQPSLGTLHQENSDNLVQSLQQVCNMFGKLKCQFRELLQRLSYKFCKSLSLHTWRD